MSSEKVCDGCQSGGKCAGNIIEIRDDGTSVAKTCPNMKRVVLRRHLEEIDPQLVKKGIKHDRHSPLFQPATKNKPTRDLTSQNLLIYRIHWNAFLTHLKWVAACKGTGWFCRIATDQTLLKVWVGDTSIKARKLQKAFLEGKEDLLVANNLEDYLSGPDLVIIRVGHIIHYNKAAANVISESLLLRAAEGKPTWIVEPPDRHYSPFNKNDFGISTGMVSCSPEVREYIDQNFRKVGLKSTVETMEDEEQFEEDDGDIHIADTAPDEAGITSEGLDEYIPDDEDDEDDEVDESAVSSVDLDLGELWQESDASKKKKWRGKR